MIKRHRPGTGESRIFVVSSKISDRRNQNVSSACCWSNRRETVECRKYRRILAHIDRMKRSPQKSTAHILQEKAGPRDDSFLWSSRVYNRTTVDEFGSLMILKVNAFTGECREANDNLEGPLLLDIIPTTKIISISSPPSTQSLVVSIAISNVTKSNREC